MDDDKHIDMFSRTKSHPQINLAQFSPNNPRGRGEKVENQHMDDCRGRNLTPPRLSPWPENARSTKK